jgi:hypothetical protein
MISVTGVLLLIVAAIHLIVTPILKRVILDRVLTSEQLPIVSPPFLLNHMVVGILLIPIGFTTIYCASRIRAGERWAWVICLANGLTILSLPIVLGLVMRPEHFRSPAFLVAASLISLVGIVMTIGLVWVRKDFQR